MKKDEIKKITDYIFLKQLSQLPKSDLVIIFGTRHKQSAKKAFQLYNNGLTDKILITGGKGNNNILSEAEELAEDLISLGVKKSDLIIENKSDNTLENVLFAKEKIEQTIGFENIKKVIAVVKHYHAKRALMTLKKHFPKDIELFPAIYDINNFNQNNWHQREVGRRNVLSEWKKIPKYLAQNDIAEL